MKIKRAVSNLLVLVSPGGITILKILVPRMAKIRFLIHFPLKFVTKSNELFS